MNTYMEHNTTEPEDMDPPMNGDDVIDDFPFPTDGRLAVLFAILDGTIDPYDTKGVRRMERIADIAGRMRKGS